MARFFISYSRSDSDVVKMVEPRIHNIYGHASLWYDKSIPGGDDWWKRIVGEIRACQVFIYFMSDQSTESEYCQKELDKAIYNRKTVLPVLLKTYTYDYPLNLQHDVCDFMRGIQFIDLREGYDDLSLLWGALGRMQDRSLTRTDRWLLHNQFEILRLMHLLLKEPWQSEDYERLKTVISLGYEWKYEQISQGIDSSSMEFGDSEEVVRILEMYRAINMACTKSRECSEIESPYLRFLGFDGNYEVDQHGFAKFLIEDEGKFKESAPEDGSDLNSGLPMLPKYRKMLREWNMCSDRFSLGKEDLERILNA